MSKSYDEMSYFKKDTKARITKEKNFFKLSIKQKKKINRIFNSKWF